MKKTFVIIKREYLVRVRTKAFLIGTIISPVLMLALIILPGFLATRGGGERRITVIDATGDQEEAGRTLLFQAIERRVASPEESTSRTGLSRPGAQFNLSYRKVMPGETLEAVVEACRKEVGKDSDSGCLALGPETLAGAPIHYYSGNVSDFSIGNLRQAVGAAISERRLLIANLDRGLIEKYTTPVEMETTKIGAGGEIKEGGQADVVIAFVLLFFIYMSVLIYGMFVMRGVIEEKQSRIVEVIVSSVKPTQMMMGKLIGIGLVGLTQIGIWALTALALSVFGASFFSNRGITIPNIPVSILVYFVVYFVLGYFLFATLYAIVGAIVSTEEEAQQAQLPVTLLIVVPMMIFGMVMANPNSGSSVALSMVPFFAPTLMMLRIALVNPPLWQVLLSMAIMIATTLGAVWLAAKIYRVGILMYGKRPSIAELGRWLRYS
jgi:ABC-2 type transport system permease protein